MTEGYISPHEQVKNDVRDKLASVATDPIDWIKKQEAKRAYDYRIGRIAELDEEIVGLRTEQSELWEAYDTVILERENERNNLERLTDGGGNIDMDTGGANGTETGYTDSNSGDGHTL